MYLVVYVDDVIIAGVNLKIVETVKRCLAMEFKITDGGHVKSFLGMRIERDVEARMMKIS